MKRTDRGKEQTENPNTRGPTEPKKLNNNTYIQAIKNILRQIGPLQKYYYFYSPYACIVLFSKGKIK